MTQREIKREVKRRYYNKENSYSISLATGIPIKQIYHYIEVFETEKRVSIAEKHKTKKETADDSV